MSLRNIFALLFIHYINFTYINFTCIPCANTTHESPQLILTENYTFILLLKNKKCCTVMSILLNIFQHLSTDFYTYNCRKKVPKSFCERKATGKMTPFGSFSPKPWFHFSPVTRIFNRPLFEFSGRNIVPRELLPI